MVIVQEVNCINVSKETSSTHVKDTVVHVAEFGETRKDPACTLLTVVQELLESGSVTSLVIYTPK